MRHDDHYLALFFLLHSSPNSLCVCVCKNVDKFEIFYTRKKEFELAQSKAAISTNMAAVNQVSLARNRCLGYTDLFVLRVYVYECVRAYFCSCVSELGCVCVCVCAFKSFEKNK